jgi:hypothetical protein
VFFHDPVRADNPIATADNYGWYLKIVYLDDGTIKSYALSNLHKPTCQIPY